MLFRRNQIEIMAPAGCYDSLVAALDAGADSVYFGVGELNMRARSSMNFTIDDLPAIADMARKKGVRTYLTVNTVIYDDEMARMRRTVDAAKAAGIDAVIVSDLAAIMHAARAGIEVHISTQCNISNLEAVKFYSQWADMVVLARELTLEQIKKIHQGIIRENITGPAGEAVKIEMFAHGALCMAVSGKCYLSLHENGCSANRGSCRQLCRRSWILTDAESGDQLETAGNYLLSPKDLCTIGFLDKFLDAGVSVLKIEGRARPPEYVKRVCECYNEALAAIEQGNYTEENIRKWTEKLSTVFNRGFWGGYYLGSPVAELSARYGSSATRKKVYVGKVTNFFKKSSVAEVAIEASPLETGSELLFTGPTTGALEFIPDDIFVDEVPSKVAHQGKRCSIKTPSLVRRGDKLFKIVDASIL